MAKALIITLGDPRGIGPEVIEKSLRQPPPGPVLLIGDPAAYPGPARPVSRPEEADSAGIFILSPPFRREPSFDWVECGVDLVRSGRGRALVTAPIAKECWRTAGVPYNGHTDYLAERAGVREYAMYFHSPGLKVVLFTVHIPLQEVCRRLDRERVGRFLRFVDSELQRLFRRRFTLWLAGVNPHAGESGCIGDEEEQILVPLVRELGGELPLAGPFPADSIFRQVQGRDDAVVVAWYHDQGLIPFKLLQRGGVNLTLGLPFIRTSPDHGTAFDIAGRHIADPAGMHAAITLAHELSA